MRQTSYFELWTVGTILAALSNALPCAASLEGTADQSTPTANALLGKWARSSHECADPEFTFNSRTAVIHVEADGTPTSFKYPRVTYIVNGNAVTVKLNGRHPIGKTPQKDALQFVVKDDDHVSLQLLKQKSFDFVRCLAK